MEVTEWFQTLPPDERKQLGSSDLTPIDLQMPNAVSTPEISTPAFDVLPAQTLYEDLQPKASYATLRDQLRLMMAPDLRLEYATQISQQAHHRGLNALTVDNLQTTSDYAIANLYHYFSA